MMPHLFFYQLVLFGLRIGRSPDQLFALIRYTTLCGVVDLLSCGRHHDPLSSYRRTWSKGVGSRMRRWRGGSKRPSAYA